MEGKRALNWRKSSYSGNTGGQCVEVVLSGPVMIRDSRNPHGAVLEFTPDTWRKFTEQTKNNMSLVRTRARRSYFSGPRP
jgi:hypothetical protein